MKLQEFQYKINNYILVTKSFLYKINTIDNDRCSRCGQESETIPPLFIHCNKVQNFWSSLKTWFQTQTNLTLQLSLKNLIFSKQVKKENNLLNYEYVFVLAKYYTHKSKLFTNNLSVNNFVIYLKRKFQNERYISIIHTEFNKFMGKRAPHYQLFQETEDNNVN